MIRKWDKIEDGIYSFTFDNIKVGDMHIDFSSTEQKAACRIGDERYTIKRIGFWKSKVEVLNANGNVIARTYSEKWYANSSVLEYKNKKYKLFLHNNPLAEWTITDGDKTLLAYGLDAEHEKISVKTTGDNSNLLFDFLLWYLFVPIATENMGDDFVFQLLLTAQ